MKKLFTIGTVATLLLSGVAVFGEATELNNTLSTSGISMSLSPDSVIEWGTIAPSTTKLASEVVGGSEVVSIVNDSNGYNIEIHIQVWDFVGTDSNPLVGVWKDVLGNPIVPGLDQFQVTIPAHPTLPNYVLPTLTGGSWGDLLYTIGVGSNQAVDFQLELGEITIVDTYSGLIRVDAIGVPVI